MPSPARKPTQEKVRGWFSSLRPGLLRFLRRLPSAAYTYDKTSCGLIDAYRFAGVEQALAVHTAATEAVVPHLPRRRSRARSNTPAAQGRGLLLDEPYLAGESIPRLPSHRQPATANSPPVSLRTIFTSITFPRRNVFARRTRLQPVMLQLRHAAYLVLGNPKHLRAARNGFDFCVPRRASPPAMGPDELFRVPGSGEIGASLSKSHAASRRLRAYGHLKCALSSRCHR